MRVKTLISGFELPKNSVEEIKKKLDKVNKPTSTKKVTASNFQERMSEINTMVQKILGRYESMIEVISDKQELINYIEEANKNGIIAIDTETNNSLDPITCKLMGACLYTKGQKAVYVPINHVNYITEELLSWQLKESDLTDALSLLNKDTKIIMHNAKFDIQVLKHTTGVTLKAYWDTMIGAKLLDENELSRGGNYGLKWQYANKVDPKSAIYNIETFFNGVKYALVDPKVFAMYAAVDAYATFRLYEYQQSQYDKEENRGIRNLLMNIEMPVLEVTVEMETLGIHLDTQLAKKLSIKYRKKLDKINEKIFKKISEYDEAIENYKFRNPGHKLSDPILLSSPVQLSTLLYDIIKVPLVDGTRGTGKDILKQIDHPICHDILEYRAIEKLLTTYIEKLPNEINPKTGKIHASFNQVGADTGRFSSNEPNLQNIPSRNKEIRLMFKPSKGHVLIGGDYSQQEPRILAHFSGDEALIEAYRNNRDLYSTIASQVYKKTYYECMERWEDGSPNPTGKKLRGQMKQLVLAIMYGKGAQSLAEDLKISVEEAQAIIEQFYNTYPKVKVWIDNTIESAKKNGYVETLWGRRRRLPDIQLEPYEITCEMRKPLNFNPLFDVPTEVVVEDTSMIDIYKEKLRKARYWKEKQEIKARAEKDGVKIKDNNSFIAGAIRQCVNAVIQGTAADMSKRAMILVHNNKRLKELGFKLLLTVHDEIVGECPRETSEEAAKLLSQLMKEAATPECSVPMKCDTYIVSRWYEDDFSDSITESYNKLLKGDEPLTPEQAFRKISEEHSEIDDVYLEKMCLGTFECGVYEEI
jgi:DNA polymerase-1